MISSSRTATDNATKAAERRSGYADLILRGSPHDSDVLTTTASGATSANRSASVRISSATYTASNSPSPASNARSPSATTADSSTIATL